jgi:SAM-dependent methyltransferase
MERANIDELDLLDIEPPHRRELVRRTRRRHGTSAPRFSNYICAGGARELRWSVPYRIDIRGGDDALDRLVSLGALDVASTPAGIAAILPDSVTPARVAAVLGVDDVERSPAVARDDGSVWRLDAFAVRIGSLRIATSDADIDAETLRLTDSGAFGTGLHPTTAMCLEAIQQIVAFEAPDTMLDVGSGSGVLALAALKLGVPRAVGVDTDAAAVRAAQENARLNRLDDRAQFVHGSVDVVTGTFGLSVANVLAAPLIEMAPQLVRRVRHGGGQLVLSGIAASIADEVEQAYRHLGMRLVRRASRGGWVAVVLRAGW